MSNEPTCTTPTNSGNARSVATSGPKRTLSPRAASAALKREQLRVGLPKNVYVRLTRDSGPCYYWLRPQLEPTYMTFGGDRQLAIAEGRRMHQEAGQIEGERGKYGLLRDHARFNALDATSRTRALTDHESDTLYELMVLLGMIGPDDA